jgi:hypothetical protein
MAGAVRLWARSRARIHGASFTIAAGGGRLGAIMRVIVGVVLFASILLSSSAQTGKVETIGALSDSVVPESIRQILTSKGYRILLDEHSSVVEIWYRKEIPAQSKGASTDAVYDRIAESALLGVLHFAQASSDYRGQPVPAGFYTLRYALMPNDGNHLGIAPSRDFLLLIPTSADPGPERVLKFPDLVALSRQVSGTKHPAPLSLVSAGGGAPPALSKDDEEHVIFSTVVHLVSGEEMPLALVVKGSAPQ